MVEIKIIRVDSKERKNLLAEVADSIRESKDYVDSFGGKSYEGFYRTSKGPKSIDLNED